MPTRGGGLQDEEQHRDAGARLMTDQPLDRTTSSWFMAVPHRGGRGQLERIERSLAHGEVARAYVTDTLTMRSLTISDHSTSISFAGRRSSP